MEYYVTFEQAAKLKELGFNEDCRQYWEDEGSPTAHNWVAKVCNPYSEYPSCCNDEDCMLARPTLAQAQDWIFRVKGIYIEVTYSENERLYRFSLIDLKRNKCMCFPIEHDAPYRALYGGLNAVLLK